MKKGIIICIVLLLTAALASAIYINDFYHANAEAIAALSGGRDISVLQEEDFYAFLPENADTGFIFYPGGKVDHRAYAPLMGALAERGILCIVPRMPGNLAVLDMDAAADFPARFPEVETWYIGGHSLGGSMAANFAAGRAEYTGLVFLAAYATSDLTETNKTVCSIYGDQDGVLNLKKYQQYRSNLPSNTQEIILEGGNHAGFGSYGPQEGDGGCAMLPGEQIACTADILADFMK